jgi:hypothetical protein
MSMPSYNNSKYISNDLRLIWYIEYSELNLCRLLRKEAPSKMYDIYSCGLALLEMLTSDMAGFSTFKNICKIINKGEKSKILNSICDDKLRELIS